MKIVSAIAIVFLSAAANAASGVANAARVAAPGRIELRDNWQIQSSCKVAERGEVVSTTAFHPKKWYPARVPATVLAALVEAKEFEDPYFGMNLRKIPGTNYPIGKVYTNLPMADDSPFKCSWWYRTEFHLPADYKNENLWLNFKGINYRANIWINGKRIATSADVAGAYRAYEFNIEDVAKAGKLNALAVEVSAQTENDLGINFVDWNPTPADKSMGLWREVFILKSGPATIRYPEVTTSFEGDGPQVAALNVFATLRNAAAHQVSGAWEGEIGAIHFSQPVTLAAGEVKDVQFAPADFPQLRITHPQVWWPHAIGGHPLQTLRLRLKIGDRISDEQSIRFGIREVTGDLNERGFRQFKINRRNILIRGGGWAPDMLYREPRERLEKELRYVRHLGLNTIRLEGKLGSEDLFDLADEMGILVMAGWCCCDHWEHWDKWTPEDRKIAHESLLSQIQRLKAHPSVFVWLNGSDNPPPADVESDYISVLKAEHWPNPFVSSASAKPTTVTGASGVKMSGPYDYVPPSYWLMDKDQRGGAFGFNTETSPGAAVPPPMSIRRMVPAEHLWPVDDVWTFHAASGRFGQVTNFTNAMNATYGPAKNLEDYVWKSQAMTYDGERAMFEAYARNKYTSTGVIQWMLNNAWPSIYWHLYDYYLQPAGGYFGARKANESLHVQYSYDDRSVYVVNSLYQRFSKLKVTSRLYDFAMTIRDLQSKTVDIEIDSSTAVVTIPELPNNAATSFLKLMLEDESGRRMSENFYWIPAKPSVLDWPKSNYALTPALEYEDMTDLAKLPRAEIEATSSLEQTPAEEIATVKLRNPSRSLAFQVRVRLTKGKSDEEILPVFWDDNYISLLPGETREVSARFAHADAAGTVPMLQVDGWNVPLIIQKPRTLRTKSYCPSGSWVFSVKKQARRANRSPIFAVGRKPLHQPTAL